MNKRILLLASSAITLLGAISLGACIGSNANSGGDSTATLNQVGKADTAEGDSTDSEPSDSVASVVITKEEAGKKALTEAYPEYIREIKDNTIFFTDGTTMAYDDGKEKDFATMLDGSDPEDMFFVRYERKNPPDYLADAGRSRSEALFKKMYGSTAAQAQRKLVPVSWFGKKVMFTSANGAAEQLKKVAKEIGEHPELKKYVDCSGTFYWRQVRGAKRQSAHSYGIAIDIAVSKSDYWLWKNPGAKETAKIKYANRMPSELVDIFERHGFIWGGAWYHYDTMHFEYRPEILAYSRLTAQ